MFAVEILQIALVSHVREKCLGGAKHAGFRAKKGYGLQSLISPLTPPVLSATMVLDADLAESFCGCRVTSPKPARLDYSNCHCHSVLHAAIL